MDKLVDNYSWVIYAALKRFKNYSNKEDLIQTGFIGLIKALDNYDSSLNTKFSSYAYLYVVGEMKKLIREDKPLKISRKYTIAQLKIEKAYMLLSQKLMREPTYQEISQTTGEDELIIRETLNALATRNLDEPIGDNLLLQDVIGVSQDIDEKIMLNDIINTLDNEEKKIISNRYFNDYTQQETSKLMGISQVQVSRKESKVLEKIRQKLVS